MPGYEDLKNKIPELQDAQAEAVSYAENSDSLKNYDTTSIINFVEAYNLHFCAAHRQELERHFLFLTEEYPEFKDYEGYTKLCAHNPFEVLINRHPKRINNSQDYYNIGGLEAANSYLSNIEKNVLNFNELSEQISETANKIEEALQNNRDVVILSNHHSLGNVPEIITLLNSKIKMETTDFLDHNWTIVGPALFTRTFERDCITSLSNCLCTQPGTKRGRISYNEELMQLYEPQHHDMIKNLQKECAKNFITHLMQVAQDIKGKILFICPSGTRDQTLFYPQNKRIKEVIFNQPSAGSKNLVNTYVTFNEPFIVPIGVCDHQLYGRRTAEPAKVTISIGDFFDTAKYYPGFEILLEQLRHGTEDALQKLYGYEIPIYIREKL